ncbi:MAG TPA: tetratricopeptide repeat protein, partial [Microvirga sp.]|nr:tetratricopeptide repeat protein [Microvirga sp.]
MIAPSVRRFAPLSLTLTALSLAACSTVGGGAPTQRIAVVEEDTQGTSQVNIASLSDVIQRNPNDPGAYNTRGAAYARIGRYSDAIADFSKAIQLDPNYAPAYTNRALALRQTNRNDQALADF